jgi:ribosomal protein S18 acetylase RimI-like enzyme
MQQPHDIILLSRGSLTAATDVVVRAFFQDPMMVYIFPDENERAKLLRWLVRAPVKYSLKFGKAYATVNLEGISCWLKPGGTRPPFFRMLRAGMIALPFRIGKEPWKRFHRVLEYTEKVHLQSMTEPHWHLWLMAVDPAFQSKGIGRRLLQPVLKQADRDGRPCYLETLEEANIGFYKKEDFYVVDQGEVDPGAGLSSWAMVREPKALNAE